jgi:NADH:ubiquinone oxidoreductase subunit 6 (subunit J)
MVLHQIIIGNLFFATMVIFSSTSLYSIISFIFLIIGSVFILFSLEVEFLSFILLLIYIGALIVLFLFIVMMLDLDKEESIKVTSFIFSMNLIFYLFLVLKLLFYCLFFNKNLVFGISMISYEFIKYDENITNFSSSFFYTGSDAIIFLSLFTTKSCLFILVGLILLFSMVGSIALCVKTKV